MSTVTALTWNPADHQIDADPVATVALAAARSSTPSPMSSAATRRWPPRSSRSPNAPSAGRSSTTERPPASCSSTATAATPNGSSTSCSPSASSPPPTSSNASRRPPPPSPPRIWPLAWPRSSTRSQTCVAAPDSRERAVPSRLRRPGRRPLCLRRLATSWPPFSHRRLASWPGSQPTRSCPTASRWPPDRGAHTVLAPHRARRRRLGPPSHGSATCWPPLVRARGVLDEAREGRRPGRGGQRRDLGRLRGAAAVTWARDGGPQP